MGKFRENTYFFLNFPYIVLKTKFLVKNKTSTNLCRRLRRRKFYSNIVLILHNYCMNIVQILYKYRSNIVQLLSKYCTTIVQTCYIMLCEYCTKYCLNNVKISYINWANIIQIQYKYCANILQTLSLSTLIFLHFFLCEAYCSLYWWFHISFFWN